jgi:hypothetical protein
LPSTYLTVGLRKLSTKLNLLNWLVKVLKKML